MTTCATLCLYYIINIRKRNTHKPITTSPTCHDEFYCDPDHIDCAPCCGPASVAGRVDARQ